MLRRELLRQDDETGDFPEPEGEIIELLTEKRDKLLVLTRVEGDASTDEENADEDERDDAAAAESDGEDDAADEDGYICGEPTSSGDPCQTTVDGPDETCYHH